MVLNPAYPGAVYFSFPGLPQVKCLFTGRGAGNFSLHRANLGDEDVDATLRARERFFALSGAACWTELKQVHGDVFLTDPDPTPAGAEGGAAADGHATSAGNHALVVKTADCQPVLFAHPAGFVAAIHVGWRGNVLSFPQKAVAAFCRSYGLNPEEVRAVRGPSLGFAEFVNFEREWPEAFAPWFDAASRCVDLWGLTRHQLREAGLKDGNIYGVDLCTYSRNEDFFSHRRGDTGRQAGIIWRE